MHSSNDGVGMKLARQFILVHLGCVDLRTNMGSRSAPAILVTMLICSTVLYVCAEFNISRTGNCLLSTNAESWLTVEPNGTSECTRNCSENPGCLSFTSDGDMCYIFTFSAINCTTDPGSCPAAVYPETSTCIHYDYFGIMNDTTTTSNTFTTSALGPLSTTNSTVSGTSLITNTLSSKTASATSSSQSTSSSSPTTAYPSTTSASSPAPSVPSSALSNLSSATPASIISTPPPTAKTTSTTPITASPSPGTSISSSSSVTTRSMASSQSTSTRSQTSKPTSTTVNAVGQCDDSTLLDLQAAIQSSSNNKTSPFDADISFYNESSVGRIFWYGLIHNASSQSRTLAAVDGACSSKCQTADPRLYGRSAVLRSALAYHSVFDGIKRRGSKVSSGIAGVVIGAASSNNSATNLNGFFWTNINTINPNPTSPVISQSTFNLTVFGTKALAIGIGVNPDVNGFYAFDISDVDQYDHLCECGCAPYIQVGSTAAFWDTPTTTDSPTTSAEETTSVSSSTTSSTSKAPVHGIVTLPKRVDLLGTTTDSAVTSGTTSTSTAASSNTSAMTLSTINMQPAVGSSSTATSTTSASSTSTSDSTGSTPSSAGTLSSSNNTTTTISPATAETMSTGAASTATSISASTSTTAQTATATSGSSSTVTSSASTSPTTYSTHSTTTMQSSTTAHMGSTPANSPSTSSSLPQSTQSTQSQQQTEATQSGNTVTASIQSTSNPISHTAKTTDTTSTLPASTSTTKSSTDPVKSRSAILQTSKTRRYAESSAASAASASTRITQASESSTTAISSSSSSAVTASSTPSRSSSLGTSISGTTQDSSTARRVSVTSTASSSSVASTLLTTGSTTSTSSTSIQKTVSTAESSSKITTTMLSVALSKTTSATHSITPETHTLSTTIDQSTSAIVPRSALATTGALIQTSTFPGTTSSHVHTTITTSSAASPTSTSIPTDTGRATSSTYQPKSAITSSTTSKVTIATTQIEASTRKLPQTTDSATQVSETSQTSTSASALPTHPTGTKASTISTSSSRITAPKASTTSAEYSTATSVSSTEAYRSTTAPPRISSSASSSIAPTETQPTAVFRTTTTHNSQDATQKGTTITDISSTIIAAQGTKGMSAVVGSFAASTIDGTQSTLPVTGPKMEEITSSEAVKMSSSTATVNNTKETIGLPATTQGITQFDASSASAFTETERTTSGPSSSATTDNASTKKTTPNLSTNATSNQSTKEYQSTTADVSSKTITTEPSTKISTSDLTMTTDTSPIVLTSPQLETSPTTSIDTEASTTYSGSSSSRFSEESLDLGQTSTDQSTSDKSSHSYSSHGFSTVMATSSTGVSEGTEASGTSSAFETPNAAADLTTPEAHEASPKATTASSSGKDTTSAVSSAASSPEPTLAPKALEAIYDRLNNSQDSSQKHLLDLLTQINYPEQSVDVIARTTNLKVAVPFITATLSPEIQKQIGIQWSVTFVKCYYAGSDCMAESDFRWDLTAVFGSCFTYNFNDSAVKMFTHAGPQWGLSLALYTFRDDFICTTDSTGFKISLQQQTEAPFPETSGIYAMPGMVTSTIVRRVTNIKRRDCTRNDDLTNYYYSGTYTVEGCMRSCHQKNAMQQCDCADPRYPKPPEARFCDLSDISCVESFIACSNVILTSEQCNCKEACQEVQYSSFVTTSAINFETSAWKSTCANYIGTVWNGSCAEYLKKSIAVVNIFYDRLSEVVNSEEDAYSDWIFSSDIFASMGLWFGICIGTAFEVALVVVDVVLLVFERVFKTGSVDLVEG